LCDFSGADGINLAIQSAQPGTTINVYAGAYSGFVVSKTVFILGQESSAPSIAEEMTNVTQKLGCLVRPSAIVNGPCKVNCQNAQDYITITTGGSGSIIKNLGVYCQSTQCDSLLFLTATTGSPGFGPVIGVEISCMHLVMVSGSLSNWVYYAYGSMQCKFHNNLIELYAAPVNIFDIDTPNPACNTIAGSVVCIAGLNNQVFSNRLSFKATTIAQTAIRSTFNHQENFLFAQNYIENNSQNTNIDFIFIDGAYIVTNNTFLTKSTSNSDRLIQFSQATGEFSKNLVMTNGGFIAVNVILQTLDFLVASNVISGSSYGLYADDTTPAILQVVDNTFYSNSVCDLYFCTGTDVLLVNNELKSLNGGCNLITYV